MTAIDDKLLVFAGRSHPELGRRIADQLAVTLSPLILKTFTNGEVYSRYEVSIRGCDVFLVQSSTAEPNRDLMELLIMVQSARLASAQRVTAVMPWYPYARQDKKSAPREPITARLVADLLEAAGVDRVLTMDLHAGQIQGFFHHPVDHMTALTLLAGYVRERIGAPSARLVVVSADTGRTNLAKKFASELGAPLALISKERPKQQVAEVAHLIGDVDGRVCVLIDDMIDTAGTLVAGAEALISHGAERVWAAATHAVFSGPAKQRLAESVIERVVVTDTIPHDQLPANVEVLSVAPILARTIRNVYLGESVSDLFGGDNQTF